MSGGYDFSQLYHASVVTYSPGSTFLATVHNARLIIRSTSTLSIVRTFQCLLPTSIASSSRLSDANAIIDQVRWSADSLYLLAFSSKSSHAWIFGLTEEGSGEGGEVARIGGDGVEGLVKVEWSRSGREVLAWADHGLRLTIHDLATGDASYIQNPKSISGCHAYSPDSRYLAVAERHSSKDFIGIYDTLSHCGLLRHFALATTDVQGVSWSPCGQYIAVYDSSLSYALYIYSPLGLLLSSLTPESSTFSIAASGDDPGLGIRTVAWAPGGRWLGVGGWDGRIRVLESETGRCTAVMGVPSKVTDRNTAVWKEPTEWLKETRGRGIVQFNRVPMPASLPAVRPDVTKSPPRVGVSHLAFDSEATLLLARLDTQPHVLHIFTFLPTPTSLSPEISHLAALAFTDPIRTARWCLGRRKAAVNTKSGGVYFWDGDEGWVEDASSDDIDTVKGGLAEGVGIPTRSEFIASEGWWAPDGQSLAVLDRANAQFCVLYDDSQPEASEEEGQSRRWDVDEGLTHVSEDDEADQTGLEGLHEAEAAWIRGTGRTSWVGA